MAEENKGVQTPESPAGTVVVPPVQEAPKVVPLERFNEVNERMKSLEDTVQAQTRIIQERLTPPAPQEDPNDALLDPQVLNLKRENQMLKQAVGGMADRMDLIQVRTNPDFKDYGKYEKDVEATRRDFAAKGQIYPREQIYLYLKGQEQIKRGVAPSPKPEEQPAAQPMPETNSAQASVKSKKNAEPGTKEFAELHKDDVF